MKARTKESPAQRIDIVYVMTTGMFRTLAERDIAIDVAHELDEPFFRYIVRSLLMNAATLRVTTRNSNTKCLTGPWMMWRTARMVNSIVA